MVSPSGSDTTVSPGTRLNSFFSCPLPRAASTACFSPAFKIDNYDFVDNVRSYKGMIKKFKVYIHNGDNELDSSLQPGVDEMLEVLKQQGYTEGINFYFHKGKNSLHSEGDWAKNIWRALIYMFGTERGRSLL